MTTNIAPVQTDREAWSGARNGEFTGSTNAALLTEPRSKAAREAGELSESAKTLIATKALEVIKGKQVRTAWDWSMKRGFVLEPAFKYLLSKYWQPIHDCTMQRNGIWIATPDGLMGNGEPDDIKCPNEVDVMRFADEVPDGDWEALRAWNKGYAIQILTQAQACGTTHANLIYCTDMIKTIMLDDADVIALHGEGLHDELGGIIGDACQRLFEETGGRFEYVFNDSYDRPGFTFIARRFEIPKHEIEALEKSLKVAQVERDKTVKRYMVHLQLNTMSTAEDAHAIAEVAQLTEELEAILVPVDADAIDKSAINALLEDLQITRDATLKYQNDTKHAIAKHGIAKCREHIDNALSVLNGTIKDLK